MSPLEAWEKVLVDLEDYDDEIHTRIPCADCHGGVEPASDKYAAHEGVVRDPSEDPVQGCGGDASCHNEVAHDSLGSIHYLLSGERYAIETRMGASMADHPEVEAGWNANCNKCHATCGQCHVSRPNAVKGGFIKGHAFRRTPDMLNQCTACHGSRVGDEYRGKHTEEIPSYKGDVHYLAGKRCEFCHPAEEMHAGSGDHRLAVDLTPRCEDCHTDVDNANGYHAVHWQDLQCTVCHSQDYKSCVGCHVPDGALDEPSWLAFKIGRNPEPELRPYEYVTLRHIPIAQDTYAGWGYDGDLPEFDRLPTWKYTVPHNIRRWTDRTRHGPLESCAVACHDSPPTLDGWFLRQVDLDDMPALAGSNQALAVPDSSPMEWSPAAP